MRKIFLGILTMIYIGISSGIAMDVHYCMGKMAGVDLYTTKNDKCGKCGMKEKKAGCCHDEHHFYKLSDLHKNVTNTISFAAGVIAVMTQYPSYHQRVPANATTLEVYDKSPPDDTGPSTFILHCVFRL